MKTIYNTYVLMESQEQCDRMKQLCIDNGLEIWDDDLAFEYQDEENAFGFDDEDNDFFVFAGYTSDLTGKTKVTEEEFIELLKQSSE